MNVWFLGVSCALLGALCWAVATLWYKILTKSFSNISLNFHKGWITLVGLLLVYPFLENPLNNLNIYNISIMMLSGAIGLGIGDTALFSALKRLSEKQTLLVAESIAPILVIFGGMLFLNEWLSLWQWFSIVLILLSVDLVIGLRAVENKKNKQLVYGIVLALVAALCQAIGLLITRSVFVEYALDPVMSTILRIVGGIVFLLLWVKLDVRKFKPKRKVSPEIIKSLVIASVIGTFCALTLVQVATASIDAAIVQTLVATSAIFSTFIAIFKGEVVSKKVWLGVFFAWSGVGILVLS